MTVVTTQSQTYEVTTLHGEKLQLQTPAERTFYRAAQRRYTQDFSFTVASDLRDIDRLVFYETLMYRWHSQLASGKNLEGAFLQPAEEMSLQKSMKETAPMIAQIQTSLGLTRTQRDSSEESVGAYLQRLRERAREHGVRREKQLGKAIELTKELFSLVGAYQRSSPHEREKLGFESPEDIITWITEYMKPEFDKVDEHFRANQQKFWVRRI